MKNFLLGMFGIIIGFFIILVIIAIIIFMIYRKITKSIGRQSMNEIVNAAKNIKNIKDEEYTREKNVSGMTNLLEPEILRDFPEFNKELLFSIVERQLRQIFNALESKSIETMQKDDESILILPKIKEEIADMETTNTSVRFDDVAFHRHAIKEYVKSQGVATIKTSSALEYFYYNNNKKNNSLKKQTRYTCEFVYVYDEAKFGIKENVFVINCPNCGAPLRGLKHITCEYCLSEIHPINLKIWKMSSYKEDYK